MILPAIGQLRHRLILEAPVRTADGAGGAIEAWTTIAEIHAVLRAISGSEPVAHDRISGRITHEIWLRPLAALAPSLRFRLAARLFHIHAVLPADEKYRRVRCLCEERDL